MPGRNYTKHQSDIPYRAYFQWIYISRISVIWISRIVVQSMHAHDQALTILWIYFSKNASITLKLVKYESLEKYTLEKYTNVHKLLQ